MAQLKMIGTGNYIPELVVTNQMLSQIVETNDEWIVSRTGISERRLSAGEPTWYMATEAARKALAESGLAAADLDIIIVTTITPDYYVPSTACIVQAELGANKAVCYDLNAACTGFVYALDLAARYLLDPKINHILIVSAEVLSKIVDFTDRKTCVLFGDGASAVICSRSAPGESSALLSTKLGSEGWNAQVLVSRALKVNHPFLAPGSVMADRYGEKNDPFVSMDGSEVFKFAVRVLCDSILDATATAGLSIDDLRYVIPHQANARIVDAAARRLKTRPEQMIRRMGDYGNTSSASIPICIDELIRAGQLERGDKLAVAGFGAGLTYGAAVLVY